MKKNEKLRILDRIDEKYLDEASEDIRFRPLRNAWLRGLSVAACALLVCGIISVPFLDGIMMREDSFWYTNESLTETGSSKADQEMSWIWNEEDGRFDHVSYSSIADHFNRDEMAVAPETSIGYDTAYRVYRFFPMLTEGDYRSYAYFYLKINLKDIDRKTGETTVTLGVDKDGKSVVCHAEVYAIRGIDPNYAIAVKADAANPYVQSSNADGYMLYYRKDVSFESFAELVEAYDLKHQMYVGPAFVECVMTGTGVVQNIIYPSEENLIFCEKLLAVDGKACEGTMLAEDSVRIGVDCGFLVAGGQFGIQIYTDGYLVTNIGGTLHTFDIGKETAEALITFARTIPDMYRGVDFYEGTDSGELLPCDPVQTSGGYIPETTGAYSDDTAVERYPIETIPQ